jgi:2-oxoglutarate dehydrogenase complex dehydrogenase (E1) component-like enzyme
MYGRRDPEACEQKRVNVCRSQVTVDPSDHQRHIPLQSVSLYKSDLQCFSIGLFETASTEFEIQESYSNADRRERERLHAIGFAY